MKSSAVPWSTTAQQAQLERLSLVAANTSNGVVITDAKGLTEWINESFKRITGYGLEEMAGRKPGSVLHGPDTDPDTVDRIRRAIAEGKPCEETLLNYAKNGRAYWVHMKINPVLDPEGRVRNFIAIQTDVTHEREREEALRQSEALWQFALEGPGDGLWDYAPETRLMSLSLQGRSMLGYSDDDLPRTIALEDWEALVHPDDLERSRAEICRHYRGETPIYRCECRVRCRDGGYKWILDRGKVMEWSAAGTPKRVIGTLKDITERRAIEQRLQESEERLRVVMDSATGVSLIAVDPGGTINFFSRGAERMLGYTRAEMVGRTSLAMFHDADEVAHRAEELSAEFGAPVEGFRVFVAVAERDGIERREWTYVCKDGTRKAVELTVTVSCDARGTIVGYLGTAVDITERKRIERELRWAVDAQRSTYSLLEAAGRIAQVGHWELALGAGTPFWSDITCEIHEVPPGTRVTLDEAIDFYAPGDRGRVREMVRHTMETGDPFEIEAEIRTAKGRDRWIHSRGELVRDETGNVIALRGVFQDIDERRRAVDLLEQRNRELELATAQAEALARAKADFLANMSHEIRTPLNAVIGMSELLIDTGLKDRERELVETIRNSGDVLLSLINDILDFSKIESGQLEFENIPMPLRDCVESALDVLGGNASRKNLDLLYWIDADVPAKICGDVTRLRQVLVNLVANAIKFTAKGEVLVHMSRHADATGADWLQIAVRDSGIGIPADRMDRLFHAFSQVDASTSRRYGGTGLGLAISHRLVELMHGRLWVESEVGKGSTFHFEIPLVAADPVPPAATVGDLDGRRVLIVNGNATSRWVLRQQAEAWEMRPVVVENSADALERIRAGEPFDLAVLDAILPDMTGDELATQIRKLRPTRELPILLLTSLGDHDRHLQGMVALTKPIKSRSLLHAFRDLIARASDGASRPTESDAGKANFSETCPLRILVAEDNSVNQRVIDLLLRRLGFRSIMVANGLEALTAIERSRFDVVLLDVQMPEMDGLTAAREICRRHPPNERPRLIALTANAVDGSERECLSAGMDDYLSKPIRSEALERALRHAFEATSR